jgi:PPK2 family polyphosphate:nucleotide phosphotransferase
MGDKKRAEKGENPKNVDLSAFVRPFTVSDPRNFRLKQFATAEKGGLDKHAARQLLDVNRARLDELQQRLYAENRWSLLLIFQGMDAAGKDSAVEHVMRGINPQGCEVHSFKVPTTRELDHDFLWRSTIALPERGRIGIFNRSYYEELTVVRVHPEVLAKQRLPAKLVSKDIWRERFEDITAFERYLSRNGTMILKFFLHVSKEEQRKRFLDRLEEPAKWWKFSMGDIAERALWDKYQAAYQDAIRNTATAFAPWHVVPADHKWFARVVISATIVEALEKLDPKFPKVDKSQSPEYETVRKALLADAPKAARAASKVSGKTSGNGGRKG